VGLQFGIGLFRKIVVKLVTDSCSGELRGPSTRAFALAQDDNYIFSASSTLTTKCFKASPLCPMPFGFPLQNLYH
jgi:hypothetical protein